MTKKRTNRKNDAPAEPAKKAAAEPSSKSARARNEAAHSSSANGSATDSKKSTGRANRAKAGQRAAASSAAPASAESISAPSSRSTARKPAAAKARSAARVRTGSGQADSSAEFPAAGELAADAALPQARSSATSAATKRAAAKRAPPVARRKPGQSNGRDGSSAGAVSAPSDGALPTAKRSTASNTDDAIANLRAWLAKELGKIERAVVTRDEIVEIADSRTARLSEQVEDSAKRLRELESLFPLLSKLELDLDSALTRLPVEIATQVATALEPSVAELRGVPDAVRKTAQASELERVHQRVAQIEDAMIDATSDLVGVRAQLQALVEGIETLSDRLGRSGSDLLRRLREQRSALRELTSQLGVQAYARDELVAESIPIAPMTESDDVLAIVDNLDGDFATPAHHRRAAVVESVEVDVEADDSTPETPALPDDNTLDDDIDAADIGTASSLLTAAADPTRRDVTGRHRTVFNAARGLRHLASMPLRDLYRDARGVLPGLEPEEFLAIVKDLLLLECAVAADPDDIDSIDPELTLQIGGANVHAIRLVRDRL